MHHKIKNNLGYPVLRSAALTAACFLLLSGCAAKRDQYNVPMVQLPERYAKAPTVADVTNSAKDVVATVSACSPCLPSGPSPALALSGVLAEWWRLLGSSELDTLMDRVLANNPDIKMAALRQAQSKARYEQTGAGKLPEISLPIQASNIGPYGGVGTVPPGGQAHSLRTFEASLRADWRPDLWGESSALYDSAALQLWRATFLRDDMQRNVVANVVVSYAEYLSLNDRLNVARETNKALSQMLDAVNARLEQGDATVTEMEQQKSAVYEVRATIPVLEQQREVVLNRLATLAGSVPGELKLSDKGLDSVNFPSVLPGVPSALILRRPDVRAVEARLLSADADIDVARARVLPPLDLTTQIGYGSAYLSQMFQPQSLFWNAIANLSITLFDNGKRSLEVDYAKAVHEEMVESYVQVIYGAVREVDDSLSAIRLTGKRMEAQKAATDSARRAWDYSQESYMAGAVDHLVVLDTERTYHRNLDEWYNVRMERYRGLVNLFSALGGGVPMGISLPGGGTRPKLLTAEIDYGAVLSATAPMPKPEANKSPDQAENHAAGTDVSGTDVSASTPAQRDVLAKEKLKDMLDGEYKTKAATAPEASSTEQEQKDLLPEDEHVDVMFTASLPGRTKVEGVDWDEKQLQEEGEQWLVEMASVYDRDAVTTVWRDLRARFPKETENLTLLPRSQGRVKDASKERASWYRLFIAKLPDRQTADALCDTLRAGLQRCSVVSSRSLAEEDNFSASSPLQQVAANKGQAGAGEKGL